MYSLDYKLQSHRFSIQTGNKKLADLCSPLYPSSRIRHNGRADITYSLKMRTDSVAGTIYEIFVDGKKKYKTNSRSELFSHLELISPLLKSNKDLDKLVQTFRGYGQDGRKGAYVKVEDDWLCAMGDIDLIRKRVKKRIKEGVKDTTSLAIYKSISTGKEYYTIDGSLRKSL